ncbi:PrsW family intramembrane metalloprotease [Natronoglycomyces albus]|uniref:PrsW family intramembrane metalloprotease n=1 Tax=Natronoglycomyces albus TaxID=2811108 RepID=A0A895XKF1_9ACTN|nr:PrsW family intramembrane metalloprotease [Natronoglycomyces albus]QSB03899.1 PrsW family intramembrane metalloprotease [Natronoglycomyces albus]
MTVHTERIIVESQGAFVRVRRPAFWLFAGLLVFGLINIGGVLGPSFDQIAGALWVSIAINGALAAAFWWVLARLDLFEREPVAVRMAAFLWGAIASIAVSMMANNSALIVFAANFGSDWARTWGPAIAGPINEEWFKALGVVLLVLIVREHFHRPMDGLIYGALIGLGFQVVENVTYAVNFAIINPNSDWAGALSATIIRIAVAGPWSHPLYSAVAGLGIAYFVTQRRRSTAQRAAVAGSLFVLSMAMHALWNLPFAPDLNAGLILVLTYGKGLIILGLFVLLYSAAARREWRWFVDTMSNQPEWVISTDELTSMRSLRSRLQERKAIQKELGKDGRSLLTQLQRELVSLGESLARVQRSSGDPEEAPDVQASKRNLAVIREELARLRAKKNPQPVGQRNTSHEEPNHQ